jgi:hypothetical protein
LTEYYEGFLVGYSIQKSQVVNISLIFQWSIPSPAVWMFAIELEVHCRGMWVSTLLVPYIAHPSSSIKFLANICSCIFFGFKMHYAFLLSPLAFATPILAAAGDGNWASAYSKAQIALAKLTNANKVALATGIGWKKGPCVGNIAAISSIGFPELCLQDGPLGYVSGLQP